MLYAEVSKGLQKKLSISEVKDTDHVTQEDFDKLLPKGYYCVLFVKRLLRGYMLDLQKRKTDLYSTF